MDQRAKRYCVRDYRLESNPIFDSNYLALNNFLEFSGSQGT